MNIVTAIMNSGTNTESVCEFSMSTGRIRPGTGLTLIHRVPFMYRRENDLPYRLHVKLPGLSSFAMLVLAHGMAIAKKSHSHDHSLCPRFTATRYEFTDRVHISK